MLFITIALMDRLNLGFYSLIDQQTETGAQLTFIKSDCVSSEILD